MVDVHRVIRIDVSLFQNGENVGNVRIVSGLPSSKTALQSQAIPCVVRLGVKDYLAVILQETANSSFSPFFRVSLGHGKQRAC